MKNKFQLPITLLIVLICLLSCNNSKRSGGDSESIVADTANFNQWVADWNNAHNSKDIGVLTALYDHSILFYGTKMDKNDCIQNTLTFFKRNPDYYQQIYGNITKEKLNDTFVRCTFIKRTTLNQKTRDYPAYLIFTKRQGQWKITTESDLVTDKNLAGSKEVKIPKDAIKGDFDGDGVLDYAWLVPPKSSECEFCMGNCSSYIRFSNNNIPAIKIEDCIGGTPTNLGDLNKNSSDEIGILPMWCTSCWRSYKVYTLKNNNWIFAVEPFTTHCNQWEDGIKPIEVDFNKEGYVLVRYSEFKGEGILTKTKSVPIK